MSENDTSLNGFRQDVEICNEKGLHARASAKFVKLASNFEAQIQVIKSDTKVDALSIMGLLMLAASKGSHITICAHGNQAQEAVAALVDLVKNRFGEEA